MPLEKVEACPVCKQKLFKSFLTCKDYTASGESFHVEQCVNCGFTITNPRPPEAQAGKYYQSDSYISHTSAAAGIMDYIYLIMRKFTLIWKYNLIKHQLSTKTLLDMGCGTGNFLNYCVKSGVDAYGVEPSLDAQAIARNKHIVQSLDDLPDSKFNVITLWHVLEHIYNLEGILSQLKTRLAENGTIFIAVPNRESFDADHYKELWAGYDVPRHVWHFSKKDMIALMEKEGLKVKEIIPMKLDAFYVSMLSEKNSNNGKLPLTSTIRAILNALKSNRKAKTEMNYSSLIYLIQK